MDCRANWLHGRLWPKRWRRAVKVRVVASRGSGRTPGGLQAGRRAGRPPVRLGGRPPVGRRRKPVRQPRPVWDVVVQPLEAINALARGAEGALSMIAAGPQGKSYARARDVHAEADPVGGEAAAAVDLDAPVGDNIRGVAIEGLEIPGSSELVVVVLGQG